MANIDSSFFFGDESDVLDSMRQRLALQLQLAEAEANETALLNQKEEIERELASLTEEMMRSSISTSAIGPDGKPTGEASNPVTPEMIENADELKVKLMDLNKSLESSARNTKQLKAQVQTLGKIKFADIKKFANDVQSAGNKAADLAGLFSEDVSDAIGEATERLAGMFDAFTTLSANIEALSKSGKKAVEKTADAAEGVVDAASEGMKTSAASATASIGTLEKASAILAIIGAAIQLATMILSLVNPDKKHEKEIQRLQDQIDDLEKSYDRLGKAIDQAYSSDASELIEQQNILLQQQAALVKQQKAEEEAKKKTDSDKLKDYDDRLMEINDTIEENKQKAKEAINGSDLKSAINDFASAYADAWNDGTDAAQKSMSAIKNIITSALDELLKKKIQPAASEFYDKLAEAMENGELTDEELDNLDLIKSKMDVLMKGQEEQYKKLQERYKDLDELKEELTDISFDSVRDNFKSLLSDMESSTEDFAESFTDMLRNALIEGLMNNKYDVMLKEWYDEFAEAMDDHALSDEERDSLKQKYDSIVQQGLDDRQLIKDIVGGGAYSQQASQGGWETMGQDTADELNGRFTALTELNAINNDLVSEGNSLAREILNGIISLQSIGNVTDADNSTLLAIRDMMFLSTGYLEDIAKYTKRLNEIESTMRNVESILDKRL